MRNLTLTGYYTTEMGIKDLGYVEINQTFGMVFHKRCLMNMEWLYDPEWIRPVCGPGKKDGHRGMG